MAITFEQLQDLIKGEKLKYYIDPDRPVVRLGVTGMHGRYDIIIHLQDEGQFVQLRTLNYVFCRSEHGFLTQTHRTMTLLNAEKRLVKWGWDKSDGEIIAYADHWIMDNDLTQEQLHRIMANFVPGIDAAYQRIKVVMESGEDPGEQDPRTLLATGKPPGDLPPELKELMGKMRKKSSETSPGEAPPEKDDIKEI